MSTNHMTLLALCFSSCLAMAAGPALVQDKKTRPATQATTKPAEQDDGLEAKAQKLLEAASEVAREVEVLAGAEFKKKVESQVRNEKQLTDFLKKRIFEEELSGGRLERSQFLLRETGLIPKDMDLAKEFIELLVSQVGGFYDPEEGKFFMMQKSAKLGDFSNRTVMAHELTHALDDQLYDLKRFGDNKDMTEDEGFATGAVIEGSATSLMIRWTLVNRHKYDMKEAMADQEAELEKGLSLFRYPEYFQTIVAKYYIGLNFLSKGEGMRALMGAGEKGLRPNIEQAFKVLPRSSEQILHPYKYWDKEAVDLPVTLVDEKAFEKALGQPVIGRDTLGELLCGILGKPKRDNKDKKFLQIRMQLMAQPKYWIHKSGSGWGGDRVFIVGPDEKKPEGLVWLLWWDAKKDVKEFLTAYKKVGGKDREYGVAQDGKLCVLTYGSLKGEEQKILESAINAPVQKGGTPFQVID